MPECLRTVSCIVLRRVIKGKRKRAPKARSRRKEAVDAAAVAAKMAAAAIATEEVMNEQEFMIGSVRSEPNAPRNDCGVGSERHLRSWDLQH
eukprot:1571025-Pleurochrysis_carterae.AAC.1